MSVAISYDEDLCVMWHVLGGGEDVQHALAVASAANHAAYELSYRESPSEVPALAAPVAGHVPGWCDGSPVKWVQNLLYNCVSNGGTDFMPDKQARVLVDAAERAVTS